MEDEPLIRLDVECGLSDAGFEVVAVANGSEALQLFTNRAREIRGLVTDIRIGAGPTGWDVVRHIREANSSMPVVYISGDSAADGNRKEYRTASCCPSHSRLRR